MRGAAEGKGQGGGFERRRRAPVAHGGRESKLVVGGVGARRARVAEGLKLRLVGAHRERMRWERPLPPLAGVPRADRIVERGELGRHLRRDFVGADAADRRATAHGGATRRRRPCTTHAGMRRVPSTVRHQRGFDTCDAELALVVGPRSRRRLSRK